MIADVHRVVATVGRTQRISPRVQRLTIRAPEVHPLTAAHRPADSVKVALPGGFERAYTMRNVNTARGTFDLDVVLHDHDARGVAWACTASVGDSVALKGPAYGYVVDPFAEAFVLVGDETALPAIAEIVAKLPRRATAKVVVEVADVRDEIELRADVRWLHRQGARGDPAALVEEVRALDWPIGHVHVWAAGEATVVRAIRHHVRVERAVARSAARFAGYWRAGLTWDEVAPIEQDERARFVRSRVPLDDAHAIEDHDPVADGTPAL